VPGFLFFLALFILGKSLEEIFALRNLFIGIGVHDLSKIFHQSEVRSHSIRKPS
jgi:hypothetical protein